jgi:lysophospholipase L1-like esterase
MKIVFIVTVCVLIAYLTHAGFFLARKMSVSADLVRAAIPYTKQAAFPGKALLVLGDSTAVGVGAQPEESVAALFGEYIGASVVENRSVSGARARDLAGQWAGKELARYDIVLIHAGANDIIWSADNEKTLETIGSAIRDIAPHAGAIYVLTAGDVGAATIFPWPLNWYYHKRTLDYHAKAGEYLARNGATYVNLYTPTIIDPFVLEPETYLAADGLHPSAAGYKLWFDALREAYIANARQ